MPYRTMSARARAVYQRTYSRAKPDGSSETYPETIQRVISHQQWLWERALGKPLNEDQQDELLELGGLFMKRQCLPSGRTLWLGGTEIARTRELSQFACAGMMVKTVFDLVDLFWLLLNGCGVGAKPQTGCLNGFVKPINTIKVIRSKRNTKGGYEHNKETWDPQTKTWTIVIGDSGEAWAKSVGKLVATKVPAETLVLDFSQIRPEGSLLHRYGWRSSGDTVISQEFPKIAAILSRRAGQLLRKLDIADIINHLGVIQTGRRGAEILLLDADDSERDNFARFKAEAHTNPEHFQRQQSNNSLMFWERPSPVELRDIFDLMIESGGSEPGFINAQAARLRAPWFDTANPCVEILLADKGFCNLAETDVSKFDHMSDMLMAIRLISRANYRQTLVNVDDGILQRTWHENNEFLHLCGIGITGVARRPDLTAHDYRTMRTAAHIGAWSMSEELGTPPPKNVTCVKPSGTVSKVMDTTEGAHKPLGRFIFNSIVYNRTDPLVDMLKTAGFEVRPHPTQDVQVLVKFPVETSGVLFDNFNGTPVNLEPAIEQLERYRLLMDNYVDQNCSITVSYDKDEVPDILKWMDRYWDSYVGVSWAFRTDPTKTAADFGASYLPQAVVCEEEFREYESQIKALPEMSMDIGGANDDNNLIEADCASGFCPVR